LPHSDIHGSTPARGSPWLFAACHVLHRLLVPRHPPNALLILDIQDDDPQIAIHHAQKPSSGSVVSFPSSQANCTQFAWVVRNNRRGNRQLSDDSPGNIYSAHNRILSNHPLRRPLARSTEKDKFDKIVHNVSEPSPPAAGALSTQTAIPRSDNSAEQRISAPRSLVSGQSEDCSRRTNSPEPRYTRPETHQNLIHISKEHHDRPPLSRDDHTRRDRITQDALPRHGTKPNSGHSAILINGSNSQLSAQENKSLTDH
jgi:hypothetical protein